MFDLAWSEIAVIVVVAVVVIGPKDLPDTIRTVAKGIGKLRRMAGELQGHLDEVVREAKLEDVRDQIRDIRNFDIKGEIQRTVDADGSLKKTFEENPLRDDPFRAQPPIPSADVAPATPAVPVAEAPVAAGTDATAIAGDPAAPPAAVLPSEAARPAMGLDPLAPSAAVPPPPVTPPATVAAASMPVGPVAPVSSPAATVPAAPAALSAAAWSLPPSTPQEVQTATPAAGTAHEPAESPAGTVARNPARTADDIHTA